MSNWSPKILWPIDYSSMTSITHWCNWSPIDDPSITHRLLYCARKKLFLFSHTIFFVCDSFIWVRRIFPCIWSSCWRCREAKCWSQLQMILNCAICNTEPPWRGNCQGVVQQKRQLKDTVEPKFYGKWFATDSCYFSITRNNKSQWQTIFHRTYDISWLHFFHF